MYFQCHVTPPSVVVLMYQVDGSDEGSAQMLGLPALFGLTFDETELEGLTRL